MPTVRLWPVLGLVLACDGSKSTEPDAILADVATLVDAPPDAIIDTMVDATERRAVVGDCTVVMGPHGHTAEVTDGMGYVPSIDVTIAVGSIARFGYADGGTEHTIVSGPPGMADGLFASAPFSSHGTLTCIRFETPGTYPIHCDRHPAGLERGTITVSP